MAPSIWKQALALFLLPACRQPFVGGDSDVGSTSGTGTESTEGAALPDLPVDVDVGPGESGDGDGESSTGDGDGDGEPWTGPYGPCDDGCGQTEICYELDGYEMCVQGCGGPCPYGPPGHEVFCPAGYCLIACGGDFGDCPDGMECVWPGNAEAMACAWPSG